jgi:DNA-binding FadR family transcriptional regulator
LAARAAAGIDEDTLRRIRRPLDLMDRLEDDPDQYVEADLEFHMEICKAARNRLLDRVMYSSRWLLTASRRITNLLPSGLGVVTEAHRAIYAALEGGDSEGAR